MNTQMLIDQMVIKMKEQITFYMRDWGYTYDQAKNRVKESSVAGPKVWEALDAEFNQSKAA